jgi:hypothetical protein
MSTPSLNLHVYKTRSATASMPRGDVGQLTSLPTANAFPSRCLATILSGFGAN